MPPVGKSEKEKLCLAETVLSLFPPFFYSPLFFSPFPLIDDRIETWQAWKLRATGDGVVALNGLLPPPQRRNRTEQDLRL